MLAVGYGCVVGLDANTGIERWSVPTLYSHPENFVVEVSGEVAAIKTDRGLVVVDIVSGATRWSRQNGLRPWWHIRDGVIYTSAHPDSGGVA